MTIQRQYSLPNCKLILEGLNGDNLLDPASARPLVSLVTNVECHLAGLEKPLTGGREFLEGLVKAVSDYAQDYLSGIPHSARRDRHDHHSLVQIQKIDKNLHRLTIQPQASEQSLSVPPPTQIDLTTVQLFDLVEAVDQFFADAQTLPDLSLKLAPLPKRYVVPKEPASKRAVPVALGVSSLVATALGLFFIPAPRVELPERGRATTQESPTASPSPTASASPNNPDSTDAEASSNLGNLDAILENSTEIVDPVELEGLTAQLQGRLYDDWLEKPTPTFTEPLEYRVGVDENGEIVGYSFVNDPALNYLDEIPLSDVQLASETPSEPSGEESIAQFLVIFRPDGVLEVSPWYGLPSAPSNLESSPTPESEGQAIESSPSSEESTVESSP